MQPLVIYASAIHHLESTVSITAQETAEERWQDQGFEVTRSATTYWFDNGVVVTRIVEIDSFPSDLACQECWINYEVSENANLPISPVRQVFINQCRESFWLSLQRQWLMTAETNLQTV